MEGEVSLRAFARRLPCRRPRQLRGLSAAAPEAGAEFEGTDGDAPRQFDARWSPRDKSRLQLFKVAKRSGELEKWRNSGQCAGVHRSNQEYRI